MSFGPEYTTLKVSDCLEDIKKAKVRLKAVVEALREGVSGKDGEGAGAGGIGAGSALQTVVGEVFRLEDGEMRGGGRGGEGVGLYFGLS